MEKPDQITNSATAAPTYPSTATPVPHPTREDKSTTPVQITSFRLSVAAAFRVSERMMPPILRLNSAIQSLTRMDIARITIDKTEMAVGVGCRILSTADLASSKPATIMSAATARAERYSIRPWPKGCSLSGGADESLKPTRVTMEEPASDRLLNASATIARLPESRPAASLAANSRTLAVSPEAPASRP